MRFISISGSLSPDRSGILFCLPELVEGRKKDTAQSGNELLIKQILVKNHCNRVGVTFFRTCIAACGRRAISFE